MDLVWTTQNIFGLATEEVLLGLAFLWGGRLVKVVLIIVLARLALRFGFSLIRRLLARSENTASTLPGNKAKTLSVLLCSVWRYAVYATAVALVLTELEVVAIGPLLAGAGILGLAVGFGAQSLVRDVISGFFILLEDQFSVGDYITVGEFSGTVEELGLRITKIRDFGGERHILPNGQIQAVTNRTRGSMRALVDVRVSYEEDIDEVLSVLEELSGRFSADTIEVVEGPTVLGVTALEESAVVVRIVASAAPMQQWKVERDLRRAIKKEFDTRGIEMPYPRRVLYGHQEKEGAR